MRQQVSPTTGPSAFTGLHVLTFGYRPVSKDEGVKSQCSADHPLLRQDQRKNPSSVVFFISPAQRPTPPSKTECQLEGRTTEQQRTGGRQQGTKAQIIKHSNFNHRTMKFVFLTSLFAAASASDGVESMLRGPRQATIATDADGDTPTIGVPDFMANSKSCGKSEKCNECKK